MKKYSLNETPLKEERETIAVYEEATNTWSIYSNVRKHITKLTKIFGEEGFDKAGVDDEGRLMEVSADNRDERHILIRDIPKGRNLTEEQKQEVAERFRKARENK